MSNVSVDSQGAGLSEGLDDLFKSGSPDITYEDSVDYVSNVVKYKGFGADYDSSQPYVFWVDYEHHVIYLGNWNVCEFPGHVYILLNNSKFVLKHHNNIYHKKEDHNMKKQNNDVNSALDERRMLHFKIQKDVDTLSKDIAKKHSLDKTHSQVDRITKRIMKSLH